MDDALYELVKVRALLVVRGADIVYSVVEEQTGNLVLLSLGINRDGGAALLLYEGHAWDVGDTVAEVDHIAVRDDSVGHLLVYLIIVALVKCALGHTEDVLSFLAIVDGYVRPERFTALLVIVILASKDLLELTRYRAAVDYLLDSTGDNVVLNIHTDGLTVLIYSVKPVLNALVEFNITSRGAQIFLGKGDSLFLACDHRVVHISENTLHIVLLTEGLNLAPELAGLHPEIRDKGIVLHILIGKSFIKIVHQCYCRLLFHNSSVPPLRAILNYLQHVSYQCIAVTLRLRYPRYLIFLRFLLHLSFCCDATPSSQSG